jgi:hypothetical protein
MLLAASLILAWALASCLDQKSSGLAPRGDVLS